MEMTFGNIMQSDCGQCFGGYGGDAACETCDIAQRCKKLTEDLDKEEM